MSDNDSTNTTTLSDYLPVEDSETDSESVSASGTSSPEDDSDTASKSGDSDPVDPVALGVDLIRSFPEEELSLSEVMDRIEAITTNPLYTRRIIEKAEELGVVTRDETVIRRSRNGGVIDFELNIEVRPGNYTCRRCGSKIEEGHFLQLDAGELGPFGPTCVRKVSGNEV